MIRKTEENSELFSDGGGIEIALAGVVFGLLGLWLDSSVGTTPLFFIIGFLFGFIGGAVSAYYRFKARMADLEPIGTTKGNKAAKQVAEAQDDSH